MGASGAAAAVTTRPGAERERSGGEAHAGRREEGRSTSAALTDESKQNVVIAFLQRSTNHKSPQKRNGKTIKSVCVRVLGLATVTKSHILVAK